MGIYETGMAILNRLDDEAGVINHKMDALRFPILAYFEEQGGERQLVQVISGRYVGGYGRVSNHFRGKKVFSDGSVSKKIVVLSYGNFYAYEGPLDVKTL